MNSILSMFGIYPDAIQTNIRIAEKIVSETGCSSAEVNSLMNYVAEQFTGGELNYEDITNSIIQTAFDYAGGILSKRIPGAELSYYINCDDTHVYINGQPYEPGCIQQLRDDFYFSCIDYDEETDEIKASLCCYKDELLADILDTAQDTQHSLTASEYIGSKAGSYADIDGNMALELIDEGHIDVEFSFIFNSEGSCTVQVTAENKIFTAKLTELELKNELIPYIVLGINRALEEDNLDEAPADILKKAKENLTN